MKVDLIKALADARADVSKKASGDLPPQFVPNGSLNQPIRSDWDHARADREGFKSCSWVYACIDRLQGACSTVPWRVMKKRKGKVYGSEWDVTDDDPRALAIEYPNDIMSRQFLVSAAIQHLGIGGNALWKNVMVTRNGGKVPSEFWPLNPNVWRPVPNEATWISGYKRQDKPYEPMLQVNEVVHAQLPDGANLIWGLSPMRALAIAIDMDSQQLRGNLALSKNRFTPETAIIDRNIIHDFQLDEAADRLAARYSNPENVGRPLMLGAGGDVIRLGLSPQEMAFIESRRFTLIEICAAYGLIPSLFVPDAKYSNQDIAVKYMWENGATRYLSVLEDAFNTRLVPRKERASLWIHYDTSAVPALADSLEKRIEAHERLIGAGVTINQSFIICGIQSPPVEGGDVPLVNGKLMPLAQVVAEPPEPDPGLMDPAADENLDPNAEDQGPGGGTEAEGDGASAANGSG